MTENTNVINLDDMSENVPSDEAAEDEIESR
jgi:hypothetical protein